MLVLEGLVGLHRTIQLQILQHYWLGHRLGLLSWTMRGEITFTINPHTRQRLSEGSNKTLCTPEDMTDTEPDLP